MDSKLKPRSLEAFSNVAGTIVNPEIERWKAGGGRVIGHFCSQFPQELIAAAGILPFRVRGTGSTSTDLADACFTSINCSFVRHTFNQALSGRFAFLDGMIIPTSCDNVRRVYDHWTRRLDTPFVHLLALPRKAGDHPAQFLREELERLKQDLEAHFGTEVTDDRLRQAIRESNETRSLLRQLYERRKADHPPITGADTLTVTVAGTALPRSRYNQLLRELLQDIQAAPGIGDYRARLMVIGGELDNPAFLKIIEEQGGLVVTDSLCFGSRMFWRDIDETTDDPLTALAHYYAVERPSCPRVFGLYEDRASFAKEMIEAFRVDGVILERLAFCDFWGFEQFTIMNDMKAWGVPMLMIDREYLLSGMGQLRTRVQAFVETIEEGGHAA